MSDERYVVLLFSLGSTLQDAEHVLQALRHINDACKLEQSLESEASVRTSSQTKADTPIYVSTWNNIEERERLSEPVAFSLQPIQEMDTIGVSIEDCAGYRSAEMVIPYPRHSFGVSRRANKSKGCRANSNSTRRRSQVSGNIRSYVSEIKSHKVRVLGQVILQISEKQCSVS